MVMQERDTPRDTFLLLRGAYDKPGDKVTPGVPAILPPLPEGDPNNRLGFARWLVDPANPLTARVAVNRFWQMYFGAGLVKTVEDFGSQGEWPSHPELLDWLATEFVRTGWDIKAMQKLIVTSATYRQSSKATPELLQKDPENRLLARAPRLRLPAGMIRDQALAVSGLLVEQLGGPSVKPYQPAGLWKELSGQDYVQDKGDKLYRRSLYTFWKRSSPPPSLMNFDAAGREACVVRESRTNTPLQALDLMNDVTYLEASRKLAERVMKERRASPEERIELAFRLATARRPTSREMSLLREALSSYLDDYRSDPEAARKYLSQGESPRDEELDVSELAAYSTLASSDPEHGRDDHEGVSMDPRLEDQLRLTRRQFFGVAERGHRRGRAGNAAGRRSARRRRRGACRGPAALRAHGQARDLPVSIGRAVADGHVRLQAAVERPARHRAAGLDADGPAADRHDLDAGDLSGGASDVQVRAARAIRRVGQRTAAAHGEGGRRLVLHQVDAHRSHQSRSRHHVLPDRSAAGGTAEHRGVAFLRAGQREQRSAGLRRDGVAGHRTAGRSAALRPPVGQRLSARASTRA